MPAGKEDLSGRPEQRVPMSRLRARVAERLLQSQSTNAILTTFNEVNMAPVMDLRKKFQDSFTKEHGTKLGFMSFFVKAAVHALKTVSYTHLDVYKRQTPSCPKRRCWASSTAMHRTIPTPW